MWHRIVDDRYRESRCSEHWTAENRSRAVALHSLAPRPCIIPATHRTEIHLSSRYRQIVEATLSSQVESITAAAAGTATLGDMTVNRIGYGAMRITGPGIWGPRSDTSRPRLNTRRPVTLRLNSPCQRSRLFL